MNERSKQELLDRIAASVIAGMDDLMGMGEVLNLVDELEACELSAQEAELVKRLKALFKKIILEESTDPEKDWESIHETIRILCDRSSEASVVFSETSETEDQPVEATTPGSIDELPTLKHLRFQWSLKLRLSRSQQW